MSTISSTSISSASIIDLFVLANSAKNVGNYLISNVVFGYLIELLRSQKADIEVVYEQYPAARYEKDENGYWFAIEEKIGKLKWGVDELNKNTAYYDLVILKYMNYQINIPFPLLQVDMARELAKVAQDAGQVYNRGEHNRLVLESLNTPCQQAFFYGKLKNYPWELGLKWLDEDIEKGAMLLKEQFTA